MSILFRRRKVATLIFVKPLKFELGSGKNIKVTATISPADAPGEYLEWRLEGPGKLSNERGTSTIYYAPETDKKENVKIIVSFPGYKSFLPSSASIDGVILPPGMKARDPTLLLVSPRSFSINPGDRISLSATLKDLVWDEVLKDKQVRWILEPSDAGSLSSPTGMEILYTAPDVEREVDIKIKALFEGDESYMPCEGYCFGTVYPKTMYDEYIFGFKKAYLEDLAIEGPVEINNIKCLKLVAGSGIFDELKISRVNFGASRVSMSALEMYATKIMFEADKEKMLFEPGTQSVNYKCDSIEVKNGSIFMLKTIFKDANANDVGIVGRYVGGEEPYLPINILAKDIEVKNGYELIGPETYGELFKKVTKFRGGSVTAKNFILKLPLGYELDRMKNYREFREKWIAELKDAFAENFEFNLIYAKVTALRIFKVTFTGEEYTPSVIPHGYHKGAQGPVNDADIDTIAASIEKLSIKEGIFYIKEES